MTKKNKIWYDHGVKVTICYDDSSVEVEPPKGKRFWEITEGRKP